MSRKFLYVSNHDPLDLVEGLGERIGIDCDVANNRHEAEEFLESGEYVGVIMTDLALAPGVLKPGESLDNDLRDAHQNGISIARKVKEKGLPLVVLTAFKSKYREELARIGIDDACVFQKPAGYEAYVQKTIELFRR